MEAEYIMFMEKRRFPLMPGLIEKPSNNTGLSTVTLWYFSYSHSLHTLMVLWNLSDPAVVCGRFSSMTCKQYMQAP